jgi:hypothetical protein
VQKQVMGFTGIEMQRQLTIEWHLPALLLNLLDPVQANTTRVRNVMLAVNLARHSAHGWDDAALPDDYRDRDLRMNADQVMLRMSPGAEQGDGSGHENSGTRMDLFAGHGARRHGRLNGNDAQHRHAGKDAVNSRH